jgi:hypothetical protein
LSLFVSASGEFRKRLLKNALLKFFDLPIFYTATAQAREIDLRE